MYIEVQPVLTTAALYDHEPVAGISGNFINSSRNLAHSFETPYTHVFQVILLLCNINVDNLPERFYINHTILFLLFFYVGREKYLY